MTEVKSLSDSKCARCIKHNLFLRNEFVLPLHFLQDTLRCLANTGNDRYSGHGYSGIHRYSGTKTPDDAILFTVSGITAIVEQKFRFFSENVDALQHLHRCLIAVIERLKLRHKFVVPIS